MTYAPSSATTALIWEGSSVPEELLAELENVGLKDIQRVALLPVGTADPFSGRSFYFMENINFAYNSSVITITNGQSLWVAHYDEVNDDEDFFESKPDFTAKINWLPLQQDLDDVLLTWRFQDTPEEWRWLAHQGGDEDWVTLVPDHVEAPAWLEEGSSYGCCSVNTVDIEVGTLHVGCHA